MKFKKIAVYLSFLSSICAHGSPHCYKELKEMRSTLTSYQSSISSFATTFNSMNSYIYQVAVALDDAYGKNIAYNAGAGSRSRGDGYRNLIGQQNNTAAALQKQLEEKMSALEDCIVK